MIRFDKDQSEELRQYLYESQIHDAKIENIQYEWKTDTLFVQTFNPIFMVEMNFYFNDVEVEFVIKGKEVGSCETIISLTAESDFDPIIVKFNREYNKEDFLYLLFQMFSGDELHIVAKELCIDVKQRTKF